MKKRILALFLALVLCLSLLPTAVFAADDQSIDFAAFLETLTVDGDGSITFDGSTHANAVDGKLTVKWSPASGCYKNNSGSFTSSTTQHEGEHTLAGGNTPVRVNSDNAQYYVAESKTDVTIKNVNFVYVPADFYICGDTGWRGNFTSAQAPNAQFYLLNTGATVIEGCSFDRVVLTSFNNTSNKTEVKNCAFKNIYNSYAIKDLGGTTATVTGCTFTDCGGGIMVKACAAGTALTISGNTFTNIDVTGTAAAGKVGTRGVFQIASAGTYNSITLSENSASNCGPILRLLNESVTLTEANTAELTKLAGTTGNVFTSDSPYVASVNGTMYKTLTDAVAAAASGDTITMLNNVTLDATVSVEKALVLDLNGKTITRGSGLAARFGAFMVKSGGDLTLTGTGTITDVLSTCADSHLLYVWARTGSDGKLTIDSGVTVRTENANTYCVTLGGNNTNENTAKAYLIVKGKLESTYVSSEGGAATISGNGTVGYGNTDITIESGATISSQSTYAIYHPQAGTLTIKGGTITGVGGIEAKAGNTIIAVSGDATITATGTPSHKINNNGSSTTGYAIAVVENKGYYGGASMNIAGGKITGAIGILEDNEVESDKKGSISISGGTFSTDPSAYAAEGYQVRQNSDGSFSVGNEQNDLAWLLPVIGALDKEPFDDVKTSDWFYDDVQYAYDNGLMTGTASRTFSPDAPVTRGMVMTILARREGIMTDRYSPWYAAGVEWAVVNGISDGSNPEGKITREELATMLYRYAKLKGYDLSGASLAGYADANSVSNYAVSAMQWAVGSGLMNGSNGRLTPRATATRAQLAAMLHRFFG